MNEHIEKAKEILNDTIDRLLEAKTSDVGRIILSQEIRNLRKALAELSSEPELNKKDIPLPSTDYLRVQADFCEEHIGLDDFMRSIAYDLKRAANEIDRLTSEYEGCDLIDRLKSELAEAGKHFEPIEFTKTAHFEVSPKVTINNYKNYTPQALYGFIEIRSDYLKQACGIIDRLTAENNLQITIDMLMDKDEQTRIGINPDDVEHKRENIQILCRILESYKKQADRIKELEGVIRHTLTRKLQKHVFY